MTSKNVFNIITTTLFGKFNSILTTKQKTYD